MIITINMKMILVLHEHDCILLLVSLLLFDDENWNADDNDVNDDNDGSEEGDDGTDDDAVHPHAQGGTTFPNWTSEGGSILESKLHL